MTTAEELKAKAYECGTGAMSFGDFEEWVDAEACENPDRSISPLIFKVAVIFSELRFEWITEDEARLKLREL